MRNTRRRLRWFDRRPWSVILATVGTVLVMAFWGYVGWRLGGL